MNKDQIKKHLQSMQKKEVLTGVPLARLTSYSVGGPVDFLVYPQDIDELSKVKKFISDTHIKYFILGNGTNIIAPDEGYRGIVISLEQINKINVNKYTLQCGAGADLDKLVLFSVRKGMAGLVNLSGIPGTIGGALRMNAGAHGSEISDYLTEIQIMKEDGTVIFMSKDHIDFEYRRATQLENKIIIRAFFELFQGEPDTLLAQRKRIVRTRKQKQPWDAPSAGSVFKRPKGYYAGTLISQAGLKGYRIGGAEVSTKHAGFIINQGKATAADIIALIKHIQEQVYKKFNVKLELEQIILK